ncbi:MAG: DUF167 domain-containing protein [Planctomycetota bacterium]|nr:DUF167 domain-containing protein [Planctomycetota bacterium]
MSLPIFARDGGVTFAVKAVPGSSRDRLAGRHGDALKILVAAPPERGKANEAICALLAELLAVPLRSVTVTAGLLARNKVVHVRGISAEYVRLQLQI